MTPDQRRRYAHKALDNHALQATYDGFPPNVQIDLYDAADKLVDDVAMATQNRAFLRGERVEDAVATKAIFGNALCMLIRWEKDATDQVPSAPAPAPGAENPLTRETVEPFAKIVYEAMRWAGERTRATTPNWVENGNSFAQTEARRVARKILEHMLAQQTEQVPNKSVHSSAPDDQDDTDLVRFHEFASRVVLSVANEQEPNPNDLAAALLFGNLLPDDEDGESDTNPDAEDFAEVEPENPDKPFKKEWVR